MPGQAGHDITGANPSLSVMLADLWSAIGVFSAQSLALAGE